MGLRKSRRAEDEGGRAGSGAPVVSIEELQAEVSARQGGAGTGGITPPERRLGEILLSRGILSAEQLDQTLDAQTRAGGRLGELLVSEQVITERDLASMLAEQYHLEVVDLRLELPEPATVVALPEPQAREWRALVLRATEHGYDVAIADPTDPGIAERLLATLRRPAKLFVAGASEILRGIEVTYSNIAVVDEHVRVFEAREAQRRDSQPVVTTAVQLDEKAPVVQVVNLLLSKAVSERASDVHIEPMPDRVRVRNRIDGALHEVLNLPVAMGPALVSRIKVMADMNIVERRRPQDGQIEMEVDGIPLDVRVATTSTMHGEKCVMRILDKRRALFGLEDLGMPSETLQIYEGLTRSPYGMVICAGPTGSGKTTTLYATLTTINRDEINVMTVEDPVEYVFPTVNQIQINEAAGITFAGGLRSILRQDPDAILVGEVRDVETARIAVQAALTGHLVLSSLHATDAVAALHRFLDMGIEAFLISSSVLGVVGQRLVRRICPECREPYQPSGDELALWDKAGMGAKSEFFAGTGCVFCAGTGYQGRIGVYELLPVSDQMKQLVVNEPTYQELRDLAVAEGMVPLQTEALRLVERDVTTIDEVLRTLYVV